MRKFLFFAVALTLALGVIGTVWAASKTDMEAESRELTQDLQGGKIAAQTLQIARAVYTQCPGCEGKKTFKVDCSACEGKGTTGFLKICKPCKGFGKVSQKCSLCGGKGKIKV